MLHKPSFKENMQVFHNRAFEWVNNNDSWKFSFFLKNRAAKKHRFFFGVFSNFAA